MNIAIWSNIFRAWLHEWISPCTENVLGIIVLCVYKVGYCALVLFISLAGILSLPFQLSSSNVCMFENLKGENSLVATIAWLVCGQSHLKEGKLLFVWAFPPLHTDMVPWVSGMQSAFIIHQKYVCTIHYRHNRLALVCIGSYPKLWATFNRNMPISVVLS